MPLYTNRTSEKRRWGKRRPDLRWEVGLAPACFPVGRARYAACAWRPGPFHDASPAVPPLDAARRERRGLEPARVIGGAADTSSSTSVRPQCTATGSRVICCTRALRISTGGLRNRGLLCRAHGMELLEQFRQHRQFSNRSAAGPSVGQEWHARSRLRVCRHRRRLVAGRA